MLLNNFSHKDKNLGLMLKEAGFLKLRFVWQIKENGLRTVKSELKDAKRKVQETVKDKNKAYDSVRYKK